MAVVHSRDNTLYALLDMPLPDDRELARVGALWIETACRGLAPLWWERLRDSVPLREQGEPGGVYAYTSITPRPWDGQVETEPLSWLAWDRAIGALAARPLDVTIQLRELDGRGAPLPEGGGLRISVRSLEDHPERVQLEAIGQVPCEEGDLARPEVPARWVRVLRTVAEQAEVTFGHVCDDGSEGGTALDTSLPGRGGTVRSVLASQESLRGYSWVTVCPRRLADRLGGVAALRKSGVFWEVEELASGSVWLRATPDFTQYDDEAMVRVFEVLAPVLPEGLARPEAMEERRYRLVWRDAAWYRPAGGPGGTASPPLGSRIRAAVAAAVPGGGIVTDVAGGYEVAFDGQVRQDLDAVWRAITDPAAVDGWLGWHPDGPGGPGRIDLTPGGLIVLPYCYPVSKGPRILRNTTAGRVTAVKDRELVEYVIPGIDGPQATTRWVLRAGTRRTTVSMRYACQVRDRLPYVLADWHCRLDAIRLLLDGQDPERAWASYTGRLDAHQTAIKNSRVENRRPRGSRRI